MIATAQRRAANNGLTSGEIEVTRTSGDISYDRNTFECQVLVYNISNGKFVHDFVRPTT